MVNKITWITTTEAIALVEKRGYSTTRPTLLKWVKKLGIGKVVLGIMYIDRDKLLWYLRYGMDE